MNDEFEKIADANRGLKAAAENIKNAMEERHKSSLFFGGSAGFVGALANLMIGFTHLLDYMVTKLKTQDRLLASMSEQIAKLEERN